MERVVIQGKAYGVEVLRRTRQGPHAVSIVQTSHNALALTRAAIESIRRWTTVPYELWVVDNFSDRPVVEYLKAQPDLNLILNTTPVGGWTLRRWHGLPMLYPPRPDTWSRIPGGGALCNGIALEIASRFIQTRYCFVMHNDILVRPRWLEFLLSKLNDRVRGAAVSHDPGRVFAMHQSGFLFDFSLFRPLKMSFLPKVPAYDPGDLVTVRLREAGYAYYICRNTFNDPETVACITDEALRTMYSVRSFSDEDEVIYLHLGRGTPKTAGTYAREGKTGLSEWLRFAERDLREAEAAGIGQPQRDKTHGEPASV